jgi:hypothetical protein
LKKDHIEELVVKIIYWILLVSRRFGIDSFLEKLDYNKWAQLQTDSWRLLCNNIDNNN